MEGTLLVHPRRISEVCETVYRKKEIEMSSAGFATLDCKVLKFSGQSHSYWLGGVLLWEKTEFFPGGCSLSHGLKS